MRKLLLLFLACIGLVGVAAANPIFTFTDVLNAGVGTLTYTGGGNGVATASVSGMPLVFLQVAGAPANNGTYLLDGIGALPPPAGYPPGTCTNLFVIGCGVAATTTGTQTSTTVNTAIFGPGGTLALSGSLDTLAGVPILAYMPIILSGAYSSASLNFATNTLAMAGVGGDIKSAPFLAFFGLPATTPFNFSFAATATGPIVPFTPFTGQIQTGGITNTAAEPSALLLLGAGLLAGAGVLRRKLLR
jgi:hypothetical protein